MSVHVTHPLPDAPRELNRRDDAIAFLLDRIDYERAPTIPYSERAFKLDRMRELIARLGDPGAGVPIIHIAGTKGKGSTATMIASILTAGGFRTGVFSSPHLERVEERFAIDGAACDGDALADYVDALRPVVRAMDAGADRGPTYFELTTAIALLHFERNHVDCAVLEVGLGGRLDSTNICQPNVSVITSISFDHTKQLGNTLAAIAREKGGIIKPSVPIVSGVQDASARAEIARIAAERNAPLIQVGRDFDFEYAPPTPNDDGAAMGRVLYRANRIDGHATEFELALLGAHQASNAAVACAVVDVLRAQDWSLSDAAVRAGLATAKLPARIEFLRRRPTVIIDAAHNVASIEALVASLKVIPVRGKRVLIFAATRDKDVAGIARALAPHFDRVILTQYQNNPRALPTGELAAIVRGVAGDGPKANPPHVVATPTEAWKCAFATSSEDDLICVTGSFFVAAEIRRLVLDEMPPC